MATTFPYTPTTPKHSPIDTSGNNLMGIIGLACAALGTVLSVASATAVFGAPLVQAGFILGVMGLFPEGAKKVWPAAALVTAFLGSSLSLVLVQHQMLSTFDSTSSEFAELERQLEQQLEQLNQPRQQPYADPFSGTDAPNGWPTSSQL